MAARILVVDDELGMQLALREVLQRLGYQATVAEDAVSALECLDKDGAFDLVLTDVRMPEMSGLEFLDKVRARYPSLPVVVMTAYGTVEDAVDAMKKGAADYLLKPFSSDIIGDVVGKQLAAKSLHANLLDDEESDPRDSSRYGSWAAPIAHSPSMRMVLDMAKEVADSLATVLIEGESGTGKEVLARYIHAQSDRKERPFVAVNCAALPEGLLESELFGHEKGAFTGALLSRKGKFELANHGTLLLDEVSEMPLSLQAKLLRVLQEREIDPIGSQRPVSLDVRVIATTNRNLAAYVGEGHFREDLFYRLQVISLEIPPLRARQEDILPLSEYFVRRHCRVNRRPRKKLGVAMLEYLASQPWRGNVRELENFLERAVLLCKSDVIEPERLFLRRQPAEFREPIASGRSEEGLSQEVCLPKEREACTAGGGDEIQWGSGGGVMTLEEMERRLILQTLDRVGGNRTRAADLLGVSVRTIRNKLSQYGLGGSPEPAAVGEAT